MNTQTNIAKRIAPEDLQRGHYVTILHETRQWPPIGAIFADRPISTALEPLTLTTWPCESEVLRVVDVCLPLVLVREYNRAHRLIDVRRVQLARLKKSVAKVVIERLRKNKSDSDKDGCG